MSDIFFIWTISLYLNTEGAVEFSLVGASDSLGKNREIQIPQICQQPLVKCL